MRLPIFRQAPGLRNSPAGQAIFVDPSSRLVMVHTAVRRLPADIGPEAFALWRGVVAQLGTRD